MRGSIWRFGMVALATTAVQSLAAPAGSPVDVHGALSVAEATINGNTQRTVVNKAGEPTQLAGMSMFWSGWAGQFYNRKTISWLASNWNSSVIRAAIGVDGGGNYLDTSNHGAAKTNNLKLADSVIQIAIDNGIYVIIDWHDHYAINHTAQSVEFFQRMATKWGKYPNVIYEIYNEPMGNQAATATTKRILAIPWTKIEGYSDTVIAAIRAIDSTNLILVGNGSWDQNPTQAIGSKLNNYSNIAYTLHFYAGTHGADLRAEGDDALANGLALFLSEWGTSVANGGIDDVTRANDNTVWNTESDEWLDWAKTNNLSWCNWSVSNKDESSASLKPTAGSRGWWPDSLISPAGIYVRNQIRAVNKPLNYVYPDPPPADKPDTASLPGRLQAEGFVNMFGIQSESSSDLDGTDDIGYIAKGDWANYVVKVTTAGQYYFNARVAADASGKGGPLALVNSNGDTLAKVMVPVTGGWQKWITVTDTMNKVELLPGLQRLQLAFGGGYNVNWIDLTTDVESVLPHSRISGFAWKLTGKQLTLEGLDKSWSKLTVRGLRGELLAQSPIQGGSAHLQLIAKGIVFAEVSGSAGREVHKLLVGN